MLDDDPDETREALDVIEHAGEQALGEMRRLLGLLRDDEPSRRSPRRRACGASTSSSRGTRASGLPVEVVIEGEPVELPPGVDVSAYRIVQEALTNALKHAGPARARVTITYASDAVDLAIVDDGSRRRDRQRRRLRPGRDARARGDLRRRARAGRAARGRLRAARRACRSPAAR